MRGTRKNYFESSAYIARIINRADHPLSTRETNKKSHQFLKSSGKFKYI